MNQSEPFLHLTSNLFLQMGSPLLPIVISKTPEHKTLLLPKENNEPGKEATHVSAIFWATIECLHIV